MGDHTTLDWVLSHRTRMFLWDEGSREDSVLAVYDSVLHGYVDQLLQSEWFGWIRETPRNKLSSKLTGIFKEGSASARRPAVTQAAAPPDLIVTTTTIRIGNLEGSYLLQRLYHKLYCYYDLLRPFGVLNWKKRQDGRYLFFDDNLLIWAFPSISHISVERWGICW